MEELTMTNDNGCVSACPLARVDGTFVDGAEPGVDRRTFISRAVLAAAAVALAACGDGSTEPTFSGSATIKLADYPSLDSVNGVATVTANGAPLAVVRTSTTTFVALSRVCPHEGGGINLSGSTFVCAKHGARFTLTGTWTGGERTSNMRSYATSYDAVAGTLTIG